ncbi:homoserine O-acetyltransferase [Rhodococcus hoagii]|nr:homoserine O-acetyltransferase [Prescottella equi]
MVLPDVELAVQRWGELATDRDNVVLVEHALTGDSHVTGPADDEHPSPGWWDGMIGPGAPIDTNEWCVIATNVLGGCRGTTGPGSIAADGTVWGSRFPEISIRDQVAAEVALADVLGIERFSSVIGGSMGGMRTLEWIVGHPDRVDSALVLAVGARATADQIGTQTTQIAAVTSDPDWQGGDYHGNRTDSPHRSGTRPPDRAPDVPHRGRTRLPFRQRRQADENPWDGGRYAVQSYLDHQADKLVARFDPATYVLLTEAMNRHDIGRGRGGVAAALASTNVPVIVGGVDSDRLYPLRLQQELADGLPGSDDGCGSWNRRTATTASSPKRTPWRNC